MRVALYTRVSTEEQSADMQRRDLLQYCAQRGWPAPTEFRDHGISGTRERRPGLDQLMREARQRQFDTVLVWRFDRFARSSRHLIAALEEFHHLGIGFASFQEGIDTASPLGKAVFTIISAMAELERNIIVERIKGGLRRAKALGKHIGRPRMVTPTLRTQIHALRHQGHSIRHIGRTLNLSHSLVARIIHTPV